MVGGVFSQWLGAAGNPTTKDSQDDTGDSDENEDEEDRLSLNEIDELTHPNKHLREELADLSEQSCDDRSGSSLKTSSFQKIYMAPVTNGTGEPTSRRQQRKQ